MKLAKILVVTCLLVFLQFGCTKLEENLRDALTVASSSVTAAGLLQSAYESMNVTFQDQSRWWAAQEHTTDAAIGPTRGPDLG